MLYYFIINQVYFLDIFMFVFILQYLFYFKEGLLGTLVKKFLNGLIGVFRYSNTLPLSSVISIFTFIILLICCFGGYFTYSLCLCVIVEFTFVYAAVR